MSEEFHTVQGELEEQAKDDQAKDEHAAWTDTGDGKDYPEDAPYKSSGEELTKLTGESRVDALLCWLKTKHGFHAPAEIAPEE